MTSHIAPHRWGDAFAGRLDDAERAALDRHADACPRCARVRARIQRASDSFAAIRTRNNPELSWDAVRAKVHWSVSTERHERIGLTNYRPLLAACGIALAGAGVVVLALATGSVESERVVVAPARPPPAAAPRTPGAPAVPVVPRALAGVVNRATGDVMIDGLRPTDLFSRRLLAGSRVTTGDGRVDVQFADSSAFALGPRSQLELRRFDADAIELVVDGTVDIEVAPRAPHQVFVVLAGDRVVEVRGTQFRVRHDADSTMVACRHGMVAVRDAHGRQIEVGAASGVQLTAGPSIADAPSNPHPLTTDELAELSRATPMLLPTPGGGLDALLQSSAPLEIATVGRRDVRLDGVELGLAPMRVRVMPGRHTVEVADSGRYRQAGWVDVAIPAAGATPARLEVQPEPPPTRGIVERRRQLKAGIDKARLATCTRSAAKQGITGAYVQIEIAVDARGAVNFLNVIHADVGKDTQECVRTVLVDVRFRPGPPATWRERVDL